MEPRFGADFGDVRVHDGAPARRFTAGINARAATHDGQIWLGRGEHRNDRALMAHELAHVVQDRRSATAGAVVHRLAVGEAIARFFGGGTFTETELQDYLTTLDSSGDIENDFDSDNKAREIVQLWSNGGSPFVLTANRKALLIREMLSGFTGNADERAILEILERSYNFELAIIFGSGGVSPAVLLDNLHFAEDARLRDFFARRFAGGESAVMAGTITPQGDAVPLGQPVPVGGSATAGSTADWNVACVLGILCPLDAAVVNQLRSTTVTVADRIFWEDPYYDGTQWTTRLFEGSGSSSASARLIGLLSGVSCSSAADTIFHEIRHQNQPAGSTFDKEFDAYRFTENWLIDRGLPGRQSFRGTDPVTGAVIVNDAAVATFVRSRYPGPTTGGPPGDEVVGRTGSGDTIVERPNGTRYTRPPQRGDSYPAPMQVVNQRTINRNEWSCP